MYVHVCMYAYISVSVRDTVLLYMVCTSKMAEKGTVHLLCSLSLLF